MKFAQHLSSHLTPEWRKQYVKYEDLKAMIYEMVGEATCTEQEEEDALGDSDLTAKTRVRVDSVIQEQFFVCIQQQLDGINSFYRAREAELAHHLRELEGEVNVLMAVLSNRRTQKLRSTGRKHDSLKLALSEYYLNLVLLQNFQQLNHTGFRKILKKFDKLAGSTRGGCYFKECICKSYFWISKEASKLIERTEGMMIDKLEGGNRSKAMNRLRVPPLESRGRRSQWVSLRAGWLMGIIFISIMVIGVAIFFRPRSSWDENFTPIFRGLRAGFILTLWFYGFAINTYEWRRSGVNNVLIFAFDPRNYLNFVQLFEVSSLLGVVSFIGLYIFVFSYWLGIPGWMGPLIMFGLIAAIFVLPLPILYMRSRLWLGKELARVFLAPFFEVTFPDFWIADQLNSLAVVFLDIEFFVCFMLYGVHSSDSSIECGTVMYGLRPIVAVLPAWFRFAQCLRRYRDTRLVHPHLVNAGKYSTSFFVVFFSSLAAGIKDSSSVDDQPPYYYVIFLLWVLSAIISSCYTFTWDIKMDWGFFEGKYKLRSELIYSSKIYYVLAVIEDLVFRSLWTLNISVGEAGAHVLEGNILGSILAVLEVFRRFVWNFFRLENEHLNNCGQFRVVRDISVHPLDLSEVVQDEEGAEPPMREQLNKQRKLSLVLSQLSNNGSRLRLRRNSSSNSVCLSEVNPDLVNGGLVMTRDAAMTPIAEGGSHKEKTDDISDTSVYTTTL